MKVFPKQKWKCFRNENKIAFKEKKIYLETICKESVLETKVKLFLKWKDFNFKMPCLQKMLTIRKIFICILKAILFWFQLKKTKQ